MIDVLAFYADESGSFDLHSPTQPWVVLLAVGFDDDHWLPIDHALNALKQAYFPHRHPHEIEIRSNDLRMAHVHPRPGNPFSLLDSKALRSFGRELYGVIDGLPFSWCASVVHVPAVVKARALRGSHDLFALTYCTLLAQLDRWCVFAAEPGRLFLDQRDRDLHGRVHRTIVTVHDDCPRRRLTHRPHVIERPYFHDSARSNHIQLADIIAYNVMRRFRSGDSRYPYYARVRSKLQRFDGGANGLIVDAPGDPEHDESGSD